MQWPVARGSQRSCPLLIQVGGHELARSEQDPNAFTAQRVHAVFERRSAGESGVDKGQGHDGDIKAGASARMPRA